MRTIVFLLVIMLSAVAFLEPAATDACAPAPPRDVIVEIASESAVIAWDEATKTQHFIRRASFNATGKTGEKVEDFGFLVPTPTQPVLAEVDDKVFEELARLTAPLTEVQKQPSGGCAVGCAAAKSPSAVAESVKVLEAKHVAGYEAKVVKASDAEALGEWLKEHKYESRPALVRWLKPYVEKGWIVTAFKIARDPSTSGGAIGTSAVRMSFAADAPFYPYSEPDDMHDAKSQRLLRVFFLGNKKMTGKLGATDWPGKIAWAGMLHPESSSILASILNIPGYKLDGNTWLTEFEDRSSPRPGVADVTFSEHPDQSVVSRPKRITYSQRSDAAGKAGFGVLAVGIIGFYLLQRLRFAAKRRI